MDKLELIEEGKIKRFFSAREKLSYPGAISHITQRASGKEPLFLEEGDYLYMLHLLKEASKGFNIDIFCFALMSNHVHLLLRQNEDNLPKAMQSLFERYAKYFNLKYERKGTLFCGRYRMATCFDDSYLLAASLYIHLNPFRAGLCENPGDYRWSSVGLYLKSPNKKAFLNHEFLLRILDEDVASAQNKYREFLERTSGVEIEDILENTGGLERFRSRLLDIFPWACKEPKGKEVPSEEELNRRIGELKDKRRLKTPQEIEARKFLIEQLLSRGYTKVEIAEKLNLSLRTIHRMLG